MASSEASTIVAGIDPRYYYLTLVLLGICTLVGLIVAFRFQREVDHDLAPTTEKDLLDPLEKAYYSGLMDEAEYERIRESMERRKAGNHRPAPTPVPGKKAGAPPDAISPGAIPDTEVDDD